MDIDISSILAKAEEVGHSEVPVVGGNSSEVAGICKQIFEANPTKYFKSNELAELLEENGVEVFKIGNTLFAMKNSRQCSQTDTKGVYCAYTTKFDHNIRVKAPASSAEDTESEDSESSEE